MMGNLKTLKKDWIEVGNSSFLRDLVTLSSEVSTVWIFTPRLQWTVVGFVTDFQRFVNGLSTV